MQIYNIDKNSYFDVIIVGSGPAGYSAGIYAKDCNLSVLICCGEQIGGLITTTDHVDNYLGIYGVSGGELADKFESHARFKECNLEYITIINIEKIHINNIDIFKLTTNDNKYLYTSSIIICAGASPNLLPIKNTEYNPTIHYCPTCDGFLYRKKHVIVVGGGNSAIEAAIYLSDICETVTIIYRGDSFKRPHASSLITLQNLIDQGRVKVQYNTIIEDITFEKIDMKYCNTLHLKHSDNSTKMIKTDAVFVCIGHTPNSWFCKNIDIKLNNDKSILVNENLETDVSRIYAAGDILGDFFSQYQIKRQRQVVNSAAEGTTAILNLNTKYREYINLVNKILFNN